MNDIKYSTSEEKRLITSVQGAVGTRQDGCAGADTFVTIAGALGANCFPVALKIFGCPTIVGRSILPFSPNNKPLTPYAYSMLGSFTFKRAVDPCSILINQGKVVCGSACHAFQGKPESVIYQRANGAVGVMRAVYTADLPKDTVLAVGGMGLLSQYDPKAEGFTGSYADVTYNNNHNVLGYKRGLWYGVYCANMTGAQINDLCARKFQFSYALLLDGGGLAAMNAGEFKINTTAKQGYAIQFV